MPEVQFTFKFTLTFTHDCPHSAVSFSSKLDLWPPVDTTTVMDKLRPAAILSPSSQNPRLRCDPTLFIPRIPPISPFLSARDTYTLHELSLQLHFAHRRPDSGGVSCFERPLDLTSANFRGQRLTSSTTSHAAVQPFEKAQKDPGGTNFATMDPHGDPILGGDHFWASYLTYPPLSQEMPPTKRPKTAHHPAAVVCCDQPCPEESLCFQDYCQDFCPDVCTEPHPCGDTCLDPCTLQQCPDQTLHHQYDACGMPCHEPCPDVCHDPCTADCDFMASDFCTDDCLDHCVDPSTACMHQCPDWCTSHCLPDCPDRFPSPVSTDVPTPVMPGQLDQLSAGSHKHPHHIHAHVLPTRPSLLDGVEPLHICRVIGCTAGSFDNEDALQDHIEKHHLNKIDGKYVCQWEGCIKKVTKKSNEHMEKEREARLKGLTYVPPPEPFSDDHLHKLKRHYYVHSGKKAFECTFPGCGSVHATKAQLKVHMARHNPKEFICIDCDKVFTTQNQLKTHINAVHKKQKHFKCPDCDYACDDSSNMSSHKRKQHVNGVPCPGHADLGCTYRDGRPGEMEKHMRACNHHTWMLDDKLSFDAYWKREKRSGDDERTSIEDEYGRGSVTPSIKSNSRTPGQRRSRKLDQRRHMSVSTSTSATLSRQTSAHDTPLASDMEFNDFSLLAGHAPHGHY